MPFKMHKIIFFSRKKNVCLPLPKISDPLPETHLFLLAFISTHVLVGERDKAAVNGEKEGLENGEEEDEEEIFYDKTKSFFDNISCESVDRAKGYVKLPSHIWASMQENPSSGVCEQHSRRHSCAYAQSDQRLCYSLFEKICM